MLNIEMKTRILILISLLFASCSSNKEPGYLPTRNNKPPDGALFPVINPVRTTAYTHSEKDHRKFGTKSALGTRLRHGGVRSAAADWSVLPAGTTFKIRGIYAKSATDPAKRVPVVFVIDDYGSALVGTKTIDIYCLNKAEMKKWGVKWVEIEIIKMGCFERSRTVLINRMKFPHIRKMVAEIDNRLLWKKNPRGIINRTKKN